MNRVCIESPWRGDALHHRIYALRCMGDSIARGEAPFVSHLLYTQVLDDNDEVERNLGIMMAHRWLAQADIVAVYDDYGNSDGMKAAVSLAQSLGIPVHFRSIGRHPHGLGSD